MEIDFLGICPKCNNHPKLKIQKDLINITCKCGYKNTQKISTYLSTITSKKTSTNNPLIEMLNDINKGYQHLLSYFTFLKNNKISQLTETINRIESSYEESIQRNNNILFLMQILITNYDGSNEMKVDLSSNVINISECKERNSVDGVINYFKNYSIIQKKKINIADIKSVKTITEINNPISLLRLKDKKIAVCLFRQAIQIFDPSNDFHCDQVIKRENLNSVCQLEDGTLVLGTVDGSIVIGDYTIPNANGEDPDRGFLTVIALPNNRIASCSDEKVIRIWKSNPPYSDTPIKVLEGHQRKVAALLCIRERNTLISGSSDENYIGKLRLWNLDTYQCVSVIKDVDCWVSCGLYQIDECRVISGGRKTFSIVNIDKGIIEKTINDESLSYVNCFIKLRDNKTIICGCDEGVFCYYDMETQKYIKEKKHDDHVVDILEIDNTTFISCADDMTIKIWKY